jgi:hypothetical protein
MAKTAAETKKSYYAYFSPDKSEQDPIMRKLCDQLGNVVSTFNSFVEIADVRSDADAKYFDTPVVVGKELSDTGIDVPQYGMVVNGPVGAYDARNNASEAGFVQKSGFASAATLTRGQEAVEHYVTTSTTNSVLAIPDYAVVKGVAVLVTAAPATAANFILRSSAGTAFSASFSTTQNTKGIGRTNCPYAAGAGESLQILFNAAPTGGAGRIETVLFYEVITQS